MKIRLTETRVLGVGLLLLLCVAGCDRKEAQAPAKPAPLVATMSIIPEDVPLYSNYMGQTLGYLSVEVRAQISGILKKRTYREGEYVKQGQLLFEIDPASAQAALSQAQGQLAEAKAQFTNAKQELDRIIPLYRQNAVSQRDRDSARASYESAAAQVESAQAKVHEAQIQLSYTQVTAPISGYTSRETRNEGNLITVDSSGSLLTTINQTDPIYVTFAIPSGEVLYLKNLEAQGKGMAQKEGAPVRLTLLNGISYPYDGVVTFIDTQVDTQTSVVRAKAQFPNPDGMLMPGQFASAQVGGAMLYQAMMIPQSAVLQTAKGSMVYIVDSQNKAELRSVQLGPTFGTDFLMLSGLNPGESIIVDGIVKVSPGDTVQTTQKNPPQRTGIFPYNSQNGTAPHAGTTGSSSHTGTAISSPMRENDGSNPAMGQPGGAAVGGSQIMTPAPGLPGSMANPSSMQDSSVRTGASHPQSSTSGMSGGAAKK